MNYIDLSNPYMSILPADPGKYIKTPSFTLVTLTTILKGYAALSRIPRLIAWLMELPGGRTGIVHLEVLYMILPADLSVRLMPDPLPEAGFFGSLFCMISGFFLLLVLVCLVVESVTIIFLRFTLKGAGVIRIAQRILWISFFALTVSMVFTEIPVIRQTLTDGAPLYQILLGSGDNFGFFRLPLTGAVCILILMLLTSYHKDIFKAMTGVEYECRLGFKDTSKEANNLGRDSILLGLVCLAAAAAEMKMGLAAGCVAVPAVLAIRCFAVYSTWMDYKRCHM